MNLRNRTLLILGLVFLALFITLAVLLTGIIQSGLSEIEYMDMKEATGQVKASLDGESRGLLATSQDWAWWDETAAFVADNNSGYIERNVNVGSLAVIDVNLYMVLDSAGNPVLSRLYSKDFSEGGEMPEDVKAMIRATPGLTSHEADDSGTAGLLLLPAGPALVASTPILLSDKSGPSRGTVIMGRYIGYGTIRKIETVSGYSVRLVGEDLPVTAPGVNAELWSRLSATSPVLIADNLSVVTGYSTLTDLAGRNMMLSVTMPRDLYRVGISNTYLTLTLFALWAVTTTVVVAIIIDNTVLRRIEILSDRIRAFPGNHDGLPTPVLSGNDELASLERTILESRGELLLSEHRLRAFINALPDPAALYARDGTILLANTAFASAVQREPGELIGTPVWGHLPWDRLETYAGQAEEAIRAKSVVQYEQEVGGRTLVISHYPVIDSAGEVVQIGLLTFDISERKRLENALQQVTRKITLLNTVIFNDIQNKVFVQRGYQELLRQGEISPRFQEFLDKEEAAVREIQSSLAFARMYNELGINPPRWQNVNEVMAFAISHIDLGNLRREFRLAGLEVYADPLLERVFFSLIENVVLHATNATVLRARYSVTGDGALIVIEDDGPGIPMDAKERIFEKGAGTGGAVGLFLAREILSITGITIRETGTPGTGARFELRVSDGSFRITLIETTLR